MRWLIGLVVIGLLLFVLATVAPSLPEGNFIRGIGESIRGVGESVGRGFGGGYGELTP